MHRVEIGDPALDAVFAPNSIDAKFLFEEIFRGGSYARAELPDSPTVIDAGANIGMFALWVAHEHPGATVLAFEPIPELVDSLRANVRAAGIEAEVVVHPVALGRDHGRATFSYYPLAPSSSTRFPDALRLHRARMREQLSPRIYERTYRERRVDVDIVPLGPFLDEIGSVDLLKVDVVGSELEVLGGVRDDQWPQVSQVLVDVQEQDGRVEAIRSELARHGYDVAVVPAPFAGDDGLNFIVHAAARS